MIFEKTRRVSVALSLALQAGEMLRLKSGLAIEMGADAEERRN